MPKLTEYAAMAADEYIRETGRTTLDSPWIAAFYVESGLLDEYPQQDLVTFSAMVQKLLTKKEERAGKQSRLQLNKIVHFMKRPHRP